MSSHRPVEASITDADFVDDWTPEDREFAHDDADRRLRQDLAETAALGGLMHATKPQIARAMRAKIALAHLDDGGSTMDYFDEWLAVCFGDAPKRVHARSDHYVRMSLENGEIISVPWFMVKPTPRLSRKVRIAVIRELVVRLAHALAYRIAGQEHGPDPSSALPLSAVVCATAVNAPPAVRRECRAA